MASQLRRYIYAISMTLSLAVVAMLFERIVIAELRPMVTGGFSGPFTWTVSVMVWSVRTGIVVILVMTWVWVLTSPVQEERVNREAGVRRRGPR